MISEQKYKKCNIITGSDSAENGLWLYMSGESSLDTKEDFIKNIEKVKFNDMINVTPELWQSVFLEYFNTTNVPNSSVDYTKAYIRINDDFLFTCQSFSIAEAYTQIGKNAYVYVDDFIQDAQIVKYGGVLHGEELFQIFGQALSNKVQSTLVNPDMLVVLKTHSGLNFPGHQINRNFS